jgi:hypothetical protein
MEAMQSSMSCDAIVSEIATAERIADLMLSAGSKCQFRCRVLNRIGDQMLSAESKHGVQS